MLASLRVHLTCFPTHMLYEHIHPTWEIWQKQTPEQTNPTRFKKEIQFRVTQRLNKKEKKH